MKRKKKINKESLDQLLSEISAWSVEDREKEVALAATSEWGEVLLSSPHEFVCDFSSVYYSVGKAENEFSTLLDAKITAGQPSSSVSGTKKIWYDSKKLEVSHFFFNAIENCNTSGDQTGSLHSYDINTSSEDLGKAA